MGEINKNSFYELEITRGEGSYLIGADGKKYLDLRSGLWNVSLGYDSELNKRILTVFQDLMGKQLPYLDLSSYIHPLYQIYSEQLLNFINKGQSERYSKVFYTNSGSEGTELVTKLVRHICGPNKRIVTFDRSYHGTFYAGISANGIEQDITAPYAPKVDGFLHIKTPENQDEEIQLFQHIEDKHESIGALLFEPVIGSGGVHVFRQPFMQELKNILDKYNILLIFDEVATGFFRVGQRFAFHELKIVPDLIMLSKSMNNGTTPMGAVVMKESLCQWFEEKKIYIEHFSTQNGNLLGIASALETLKFYKEKEEMLLINVKEIEKIIRDSITTHTKVNGKGAMFSIPINDRLQTMGIVEELKKIGILTYLYINSERDNGLTLFPPLLIESSILTRAMKMVARRV